MIEYPDVSHYNAPLSLRGAPLVFAKATQGTRYTDPTFSAFWVQAQRLGIPFGGYHWLDTSDAVAQARHAFSVIGAGVPTMIDDEQPSISVGHTLEFVVEYRRLGGVVRLEYLPRWTWEASGKPNLRPLAAAGLHLVASDYRPADAPYPGGAAWAPYGGVTPTILQLTDKRSFNGRPVDFNHFPGSLAELLTVITGEEMALTDDEHRLLANCERVLTTWASDQKPFGIKFSPTDPGRTLANPFQTITPTLTDAQVTGLVQQLAPLVAAQMPKPPTADEIADRLATRLGNG